MAIHLVVFGLRCTLVPGIVECARELRTRGIRIGTTCDTSVALDVDLASAVQRGFMPDVSLSADTVPEGHPAPWMIFRIMEQLRIYPAKAVLKVGDTPSDIAEGLNAGAWTVGVVDSSSEIGLSKSEFAALSESERESHRARVRDIFLEAGADAVIDGLQELTEAIDAFGEM